MAVKDPIRDEVLYWELRYHVRKLKLHDERVLVYARHGNFITASYSRLDRDIKIIHALMTLIEWSRA